ncbi:long-chain fatty acid--CoA ligase [Aeromicrobium ponti]|uniref:Fatty-acyl-CoA synthase n=1 Tax=Cytobacillus oceanisediminis TaxID=665099 RepID=A0A562JPJ7_9BACI|nr:long-chain fatty acid--CoA ligase [Cytobacillus oceanisediminis]TWH85102.1 fatty-acyl-CoA synthase [Cytobacillus oceanisediminis]
MGREFDWLENRAGLKPDSIAIIDAEQNKKWTYSEIYSRTESLAGWLNGQGIQKGDRVALLAPNDISYFDLLFACGKIGAIFVPVNWRLSIEEMKYILEDCTPKIVAYHSQFSDTVDQLENNAFKSLRINGEQYNQVAVSSLRVNYNELLNETDPLAMIYTGGTTGKPKGVVLSHQSILWNGLNTVVSWNLSEEDITLTYMPLFHTGGLNALSIPLLMTGGTVVLGNDYDPRKAIEYLNHYRCTIVLLVPTMYHMMTETSQFQQSSFPYMKVFLSGGAPCPLDIYEKFKKKGLLFKEGYGLTEAGPNNFFIKPEEADDKRGSVGKPMVFNKIKIIKENGLEAGPHEVGELLVKGKHSFSCYWNNEKATQAALKNGWLHTGDLAKRDKEGYYYIVGRKKDMIITGGENVYPLEVEHWLSSHPQINEAAVIGIPDRKWGETVSAFISLKGDQTLSTADLKEYCGCRLGRYKIPKHIFFVKELPKTPVGKIDKKKLKMLGRQLTQEKKDSIS